MMNVFTILGPQSSMRGRKVSGSLKSLWKTLANIFAGWNCCKPRVLTFDEFLSIAPCTTGKHSAVSKPPAVVTQPTATEPEPVRIPAVQEELSTKSHPTHQRVPPAPAVEPQSDSDDPSFSIPPNTACRRRGCGAYSSPTTASSREEEKCIYHPGHPIFHEGTKGWTCCKKRVLEFDEFMRIEGCSEKSRHMYVGSGKKNEAGSTGEKNLETVRFVDHQPGLSNAYSPQTRLLSD